MLSKYKTIQILLTNVHLDCRGEGSSDRNASRDESVETGDESVETRDESIEAGEKTQQSCYNNTAIYTMKFFHIFLTKSISTQTAVLSHMCLMKNNFHFPNDIYVLSKSLYFLYSPGEHQENNARSRWVRKYSRFSWNEKENKNFHNSFRLIVFQPSCNANRIFWEN